MKKAQELVITGVGTLFVLLAVLLAGGSVRSSATETGCAGTIDPSFSSSYLAPSGRLSVVSGTNIYRAVENSIARLREDGSIDLSWGVMITGYLSVITVDSAGRLVIAGSLTQVDWTPKHKMARLLPNGAIDNSFELDPSVAQLLSNIQAIAFQEDGKILLAAALNDAIIPFHNSIIRLLPNGAKDPTFNLGLGANDQIDAIAVQPDGKIVFGGIFTDVSGHARQHICRAFLDGSIDDTFNPPAFLQEVNGIQALPDGRLLAYGSSGFVTDPLPDTALTSGLVRLQADGQIDPTFHRVAEDVRSLAVQSDGKYLIAGKIIAMPFYTGFCKRILPNGLEDLTFHSLISAVSPLDYQNNWELYANTAEAHADFVTLDAAQRILVGGNFPWANGIPANGFVRLLNDGSSCIPLLSFESATLVVEEGGPDAVIPIIRTGDLSTPCHVEVTVVGAYGTLPRFAPLQTNITFPSGSGRQFLTIPLPDNGRIEPGFRFGLRLNNASPGAAYGEIQQIVISVIDASSREQPGAIDRSFVISTNGVNILDTGVAPDQKIYAVVETQNYESTLVRLNLDGSRDLAFNCTNRNATSIAVAGDKLYLSCSHDSELLLRLLPDGSRDSAFTPPTFAYFSSYLLSLTAFAVESDGKIVVSGPFSYVNGVARYGVARINPDGSLDEAFDPANGSNQPEPVLAKALRELPDGTWLLGGGFSEFGDQPREGIVRLAHSGQVLEGFRLPVTGFGAEVDALQLLPNGDILAGGRFSFPDEGQTRCLVRFKSSGEFDPTFRPDSSTLTTCDDMVVEPDGKIVVAGLDNLTLGKTIVRFWPDGFVDPSFFIGAQVNSSLNLALHPNGLLVGGSFNTFNEIPANGLVLLRLGAYTGPGVAELQSNATVLESAGAARLKVRRTLSTHGEARFQVQTHDDTAVAGVNYVATDSAIVFADGESEKEVSIPIIDVPGRGTDLVFSVSIRATTPAAAVAYGKDAASVTITDKEAGFTIFSAAPRVLESPFSYFYVTVNRVGPFTGPASVEVATDGGTATPGVDYEALVATLHFDTTNDVSHTLLIPVIYDDVPELPETIQVALRNPSGAPLLSPSTLELTIQDGSDLFVLNNSLPAPTQDEGLAQILVQRAAVYFSPHAGKVYYRTEGGTAIPGIEYVPQEGVLDFNIGDSGQFITIPLLHNSIVGPPTTIGIRITGVEGRIAFTNTFGTIAIRHPTVVAPAGSVDKRFTQIFSDVDYLPGSLYPTPNYIYFLQQTTSNNAVNLRRSDLNGKRDENYNLDFGSNWPVIFGLNGGRLLAVGAFTNSAGMPSQLMLLDAAGKPDPAFAATLPPRFQPTIALGGPSGTVILGGAISLPNSQFSPFLTRLLPSGAVDDTFGIVYFEHGYGSLQALAQQKDGKLLAAGTFSGVEGVQRTNLLRLNAQGRLDPTFRFSADPYPYITSLFAQEDGKALANGTFNINGKFRSCIRLNADGSVDDSWNPVFASRNDSGIVGVDSVGRAYAFDGSGPNSGYKLVRLLPDGSNDPGFYTLNGSYTAKVAPEGLYTFGFNSQGRLSFTRLFTEAPSIFRQPQILEQGAISHYFNFPAGLPYVLEQSSDLVHWTEKASGTSAEEYVTFQEVPNSTFPQFYRVRQR